MSDSKCIGEGHRRRGTGPNRRGFEKRKRSNSGSDSDQNERPCREDNAQRDLHVEIDCCQEAMEFSLKFHSDFRGVMEEGRLRFASIQETAVSPQHDRLCTSVTKP